MADLGVENELINATKVALKLGGDTYIFLQECELHMGRPEAREPTTDGGVLYYYGKGDHWLTFTILATTPELDDFASFTETDANGDLTEKTWTLVTTDRGSASPTATSVITGVLPDYTIQKTLEGAVLLRGRIRITGDTVPVTVA